MALCQFRDNLNNCGSPVRNVTENTQIYPSKNCVCWCTFLTHNFNLISLYLFLLCSFHKLSKLKEIIYFYKWTETMYTYIVIGFFNDMIVTILDNILSLLGNSKYTYVSGNWLLKSNYKMWPKKMIASMTIVLKLYVRCTRCLKCTLENRQRSKD